MKPRNTLNISLAVILTGLIIIVALDPGKESNLDVNNVLLTNLKTSDIHNISINNKGKSHILLNKDNKIWQLTKPINYKANSKRIDRILAISQTKSHSQYFIGDVNLQQLKLSEPELTLTLNNSKLSFGATDAINGYRYILIKDTVHLITDRYSQTIRGEPEDFLDPGLLPENVSITRLVLPDFTLTLKESGWHVSSINAIKSNKSFSADNLTMFLNEWRYAQAKNVRIINADYTPSKVFKIIVNTGDQIFTFHLTKTSDEIILTRPDVGLSYHFDTTIGEKLLTITNTDSNNNA